MRRLSLLFFVFPAVGCEPTLLPPDELADLDADRSAACDPLMDTFPVGGDHNIGYDSASCGTGTCEISCPDENANSDWGGDHHGIDVFAWHRAPLVAVADATVVAVGTPSSTSGLRVRIQDACGWEYYYGHMDEAVVSVGQVVKSGDLLGYMGYTGTHSDHLHFNVSPWGDYNDDINPFDLLNGTSPTACGGQSVPNSGGSSSGGSSSGGSSSGGSSGGVEIPVHPGGCGFVGAGQGLPPNSYMPSCDGRFSLWMQDDGNLVLYGATGAMWSSGTWGHPGAVLWMQGDGNLVVYDASGRALWDSHTWGHPGAALAVQDDGNVVIYEGSRALWDTHTCCH